MLDMAYIRANVPREELLAGLAEEASELAQAALKYRRTLDGTNPARVGREEAWMAMLKELADVELQLEALGIPDDGQAMRSIHETVREKTKRWREHLEKGRDRNGVSGRETAASAGE